MASTNKLKNDVKVNVNNQNSTGKAEKQSKIEIKLKAYDHQLVDNSAKKIIETAVRTGSSIVGPIPLPTKKEKITILRAPHKYKDAREQFEMRTHKRLLYIVFPTSNTIDALMKLDLPAGVSISMKVQEGNKG